MNLVKIFFLLFLLYDSITLKFSSQFYVLGFTALKH
jgi:hypothetical protein